MMIYVKMMSGDYYRFVDPNEYLTDVLIHNITYNSENDYSRPKWITVTVGDDCRQIIPRTRTSRYDVLAVKLQRDAIESVQVDVPISAENG